MEIIKEEISKGTTATSKKGYRAKYKYKYSIGDYSFESYTEGIVVTNLNKEVWQNPREVLYPPINKVGFVNEVYDYLIEMES
jgi:hypothetical protein